jgi:hypothetical protein
MTPRRASQTDFGWRSAFSAAVSCPFSLGALAPAVLDPSYRQAFARTTRR